MPPVGREVQHLTGPDVALLQQLLVQPCQCWVDVLQPRCHWLIWIERRPMIWRKEQPPLHGHKLASSALAKIDACLAASTRRTMTQLCVLNHYGLLSLC